MKKSEQSASEKVIKSEEWEFYCLVGLFRIISMVEFKNNLCSAKTLTFSITVNYWPTQTNLSTAASSSSPLFPDLATVVTTFQYSDCQHYLWITYILCTKMRLSLRGKMTSIPVYVHTSPAIFSDSGVKASYIWSLFSQGVLFLFFLITLWFSVSYNLILYILPICPNFVHQIVSSGMTGRCHGAMLGLAPLFTADYNHHLKCGEKRGSG